jgi:hypothetical protein
MVERTSASTGGESSVTAGRRRVLGTAGGTAIGGIAGCLGGEETTERNAPPGTDDETAQTGTPSGGGVGTPAYVVWKDGDTIRVADDRQREVHSSNDAATAIQWAIDELPDGGGKVSIREGNYTIGETIDLREYVTLEGQGKKGNTTLLAGKNELDPLLNVEGTGSPNNDTGEVLSRFTIRDLNVRTSPTDIDATYTGGTGIRLRYAGQGLLHNVHCAWWAGTALDMLDADVMQISDCGFHIAGDDEDDEAAVEVDATDYVSTYNLWSNVHITRYHNVGLRIGEGGTSNGNHTNFFANCQWHGSNSDDIGAVIRYRDCYFSNCHWSANDGRNLEIYAKTSLSNCRSRGGKGIYVNGSVDVSNCRIGGSSTHGIELDGAWNCRIDGVVQTNSGDGVHAANTHASTISVTAATNAGYGVNAVEGSGSEGNLLHGCLFKNNEAGAVTNLADNSVVGACWPGSVND